MLVVGGGKEKCSQSVSGGEGRGNESVASTAGREKASLAPLYRPAETPAFQLGRRRGKKEE